MKLWFVRQVTHLLVLLILLSACHHHRSYYEEPPLKDVRFTASAKLTGTDKDSFVIRAVGVNHAMEMRHIAFGASCNMTALAIRDGRIWNYESMLQSNARTRGAEYVCLASRIERGLAPHDSIVFELRIRSADVLGDSLPAGSYAITALVRVAGLRQNRFQAGTIELRAPAT
jgi:hypothetical protein